ncbi:MAG: hypothetical protein ACRC6X_03725 [Culicoidibacterales bacterium]
MNYKVILNRITAGLSMVYAGVATGAFTKLNDFINKNPDFTKFSQQRQLESFDAMLYIALFSMFILGLCLLVLGIITLITNSKLPKGNRGKALGILASIMTIMGFLIGLVPIISTIYIVITAICYFISAHLIALTTAEQNE